MNSIASWILNNRPAKRTQKAFVNWSHAKSVLLLANEQHLPHLPAFIDKAAGEGKTVLTVFTYKGKPEQAPAFKYPSLPVPRKKLTVFGLPHEEVISGLNSGQADVLVSLAHPDDMTLLAMAKLTSAPCKISGFEHAVFDMSISAGTQADPKVFLEQVYTYLNMIKN